MRISDWSSDVCSSDLEEELEPIEQFAGRGLLLEPGDVADLVEDVERLADEQLLDAGEMDVDDRLHRLAARKSDVMEEAAAQERVWQFLLVVRGDDDDRAIEGAHPPAGCVEVEFHQRSDWHTVETH